MLSSKKVVFLFSSILLLFIACKTEIIPPEISQVSPEQLKNIDKANKNLLQTWYHKDIIDDSIPGISLDKAYSKLIKNKTGEVVTVAVIDMEVAIGHEDLKDNIWKNTDEIPGNNKDDDNNGYVDDIHGWNFLGNVKGESILFANYEYTRIIKKFDNIFKDKTIEDIPPEQQNDFLTYQRAWKKYNERMKYALEEKNYIDSYERAYKNAVVALKDYFPNKNYTVKKVDSIKNLENIDPKLKRHLNFISLHLKYNLSEEWIEDYKLRAHGRVDKLLNLEYNEREIPRDDPEDITDIGYGSPILNANTVLMDHGTLVAGIIVASRTNNIGTKGITDNIKIMPLCISPYGDEHDKDMALAIHYAVDNGAKVINISSSKEFSLRQDWIHDAMKYAADHNVLIVTSAGNNGNDLNDGDSFNYPNDTQENGAELVDNFIKVGASSYSKELIRPTSNYGKEDVDIFAPGTDIYTTSPQKEKYEYIGGTSFAAPIVSGIAALIRSYYPNLYASEVKDIILQSGVTYNIDVEIKQEDDTKKTVPFSELSKSGKVVNAYNALLMAKRIGKKK